MNIFKIIPKLINKTKKDEKDIIIEELTKNEEKKDKLLLTTMWIFLTIMLIFFLIICLLVVTYITEESLQLVVIIGTTIVLLIGAFFCLKLEVEAGYYECSKCHHRHKPSYSKVLCSMHFSTTRYLMCPECGNKSWSKKVLSK